MDAYEFTRFEADFTSKVKAQAYEASVVATLAKQAFDEAGIDYKQDADYIDAKHVFIELTMSCDMQEAINWMKYWMADAIAYGIMTKNLDWRTKFLAAYDIFNDLVPVRAGSNAFMKFNQVC